MLKSRKSTRGVSESDAPEPRGISEAESDTRVKEMEARFKVLQETLTEDPTIT